MKKVCHWVGSMRVGDLGRALVPPAVSLSCLFCKTKPSWVREGRKAGPPVWVEAACNILLRDTRSTDRSVMSARDPKHDQSLLCAECLPSVCDGVGKSPSGGI